MRVTENVIMVLVPNMHEIILLHDSLFGPVLTVSFFLLLPLPIAQSQACYVIPGFSVFATLEKLLPFLANLKPFYQTLATSLATILASRFSRFSLPRIGSGKDRILGVLW
jgi:hypothetical protein